jgi:hypothetical protein
LEGGSVGGCLEGEGEGEGEKTRWGRLKLIRVGLGKCYFRNGKIEKVKNTS